MGQAKRRHATREAERFHVIDSQYEDPAVDNAEPGDPLGLRALPWVQIGDSPLWACVPVVTPELAAKWLTRNHPNNRPIGWKAVESLANDIREGSWRLLHQGIAFDADSFLIDGQHRLKAVEQSGQSISVLVIQKRTVGSFHDPIDRGRPRSIGTILGMHGRVIACANVLRMMEEGCESRVPMTLAEAEAVIERHREPIEALAKLGNRQVLSGAVLAACAWGYPVDVRRTMLFAEQIAVGEMIGRGLPAFAFRNWIPRNKGLTVWTRALAALNCLRFAINEMSMLHVETTTGGYRAFCSRRRHLKVPNTPAADIVPPMNWAPGSGRKLGGDDEQDQ